jgi:hypothetical protein
MIDYDQGLVYQKKGAWKYRGSARKFATREEAVAAAERDGFAVAAEHAEVLTLDDERSPLEVLRGIKICDNCHVHPCECQWKSQEKILSPIES